LVLQGRLFYPECSRGTEAGRFDQALTRLDPVQFRLEVLPHLR